MADLYIRGKDGRPRLIGRTADPELPGRVTALEERMEAIEAAPGGVPLSDAVDSTSSTTAATSKAVKTAWDKASGAAATANAAQSAATAAKTAADTAQSRADSAYTEATTAASTSAAGRVQLSDAVDSDSSTTAATSRAVKTVWDKASAADAAASAATFPAGTRLLFHQAAAPTGWVKQTDVDDATLRVVSGDSGGGTGGSLAFSTLFAEGRTATLSGSVGETTLTSAQNGTHHHATVVVPAYGSYGGFPQDNHPGTSNQQAIGGSIKWIDSRQVCGTWYDGESEAHTHDLSGTATIALNVRYTDVIICAKA